jgi:hypothetical protein
VIERQRLGFAAALVLAASATTALLWPPGDVAVAEQPAVQPGHHAERPAEARRVTAAESLVSAEHPDPFYPRRQSAQEAVPIAVEPAPPPPPVAPPFAYRVMGRISAPGQAVEGEAATPPGVYLERGELLVKAEVGTELEDGYRVASIGADGIVVTHPLLEAPINVTTAPLAQTE